MPLTRDLKATIRARVERDPRFRRELLRKGVEAMLAGDVATAKTILRDYINATIGFSDLAEAPHISSIASCDCSDHHATRAPAISSRSSASSNAAKACASSSRPPAP